MALSRSTSGALSCRIVTGCAASVTILRRHGLARPRAVGCRSIVHEADFADERYDAPRAGASMS
ncbi:MAG: hypothetical protein U0838_02580 [Chloroflexota bacterium]